jgi:AraC family transcriptional regulator of adaptative response/methylated-DNA-[protein]-cysteine methyltransferase
MDMDKRWKQVVTRDAAADGTFVYAVRTTGVYCRPSCGARLARPENVEFYSTTESAQRAGFRACKRCKPDDLAGAAERVAAMCREIESSESMPKWGAAQRKLFVKVTGLTPRGYAEAHRDGRVREALRTSASVTDAIYEAGFESSGRFYEGSGARLGMTPSEYREGGKGTEIQFATGQCSLGSVIVGQTARGVCFIAMGDDPLDLRRELEVQFPKAQLIAGDAKFARTIDAVVRAIEAPAKEWKLPLDVQGTVFQQHVWQALRQIPPGTTRTYTEVAKMLGMPKAVRAVARACATNPVAVAVPCHRVIRGDGSLAGYRWGVDRKQKLLDRERQK